MKFYQINVFTSELHLIFFPAIRIHVFWVGVRIRIRFQIGSKPESDPDAGSEPRCQIRTRTSTQLGWTKEELEAI